MPAVVDGCDQVRDRRSGIRNGPCSPPLAFNEPSYPQQLLQQRLPSGYYTDAAEASIRV